ncbi:DUF115 domain-containing protein [Paraglaciecola sp.]|nr:DUF115 domain-containing protein [Paraglaciecola sp.]
MMTFNNELDKLEKIAEDKFKALADHQDLEQKLSHSMQLKFADNIAALSLYLPDIYKQFKDYPPENLQITCTKTGVANIFDQSTNSFLYSEDPVKQCREQVDHQIQNPQFTALSFKENEDEHGFIHTKYMNKLNDLFVKASKDLKPITTMPDHIGSMIIFGIGLGYHLTQLLEDITIEHLYLCEPNCDWFYASLYTADWKFILETIDTRDGSVSFYLGSSYENFTNDFLDDLLDKGSFNSVNAVLYQHYPSNDLQKLITQFSKDFHRCAIGWGFFDDGIISIAHDFVNGQQQIPLLKAQANIPSNLQNIPVFVVANGPSFDTAIETIKSYQSKVIIFSCGSAIQPLLANGIIPDFHVANERTKSSYHYLSEFIDNDILQQINFLTTNIMHPKCTELFKWSGMAFKPAEPSTVIASEYIDQGKNFAQLMFSNPVVGNTGASFACYMGFKEIYLFGLDFGYEDPSHHHSKDSLYYNKDNQEIESLGHVVRSGEIEVKGNFVEKVFSTTFFNVGRHCLEGLLTRFNHVHCYNCSEGAKVERAAPLRVDDILLVNTADKNKLISHIKNNLFIARDFSADEYIKWLDYDEFDDICDTLISFLDKDFNTRAEMVTALKLQARYLFSYSQTRHRHIYFMLKGSLTYVQSIFKMMLYSFDDEQAALRYSHECIEVFIHFMTDAKALYANCLNEVSEHEWAVSDIVKNASK